MMNRVSIEKQSETTRANAVPESVSHAEDVRTLQRRLLRGMLRAAAIVGFLVAVAGTYDSYLSQGLWTIPFYWASYGLVVLLLLWRGAPYALQAWVLTGMVYVLGVIDFAQEGPGGSSRVFMLTVPFLAGVLLSRRESIFALVLSSLTMAGFGLAWSAGLFTNPSNPSASDPANWIVGTLALFMLGTLMVVSLNYLVPRLTAALTESRGLAAELAEQRDQLEVQVTERTAELMRRSTQLETAAQIAHEAVLIRDVDQLLEETVHLVSDRFGFYHTGIFLLDEAREYAVLRAASSEGGLSMLAAGHRLRVGEVGIVGYVTGRGEPRIALDVGADAVFFDNPDLPETRSEMALPLQTRGEIIGALDVQSKEPAAFGEDDVFILQALADQVAVAISNAHLFRQVEQSLEEERRTYGELSSRAWRELLRSQPNLGFLSDAQGVIPAGDLWEPQMVQAVRTGEVTWGKQDSATVAIPIRLRDQVIGMIDAQKPDGAGSWDLEEIEMLRALVDRLETALEGARLYQDAQRHAARDRLLAEVSSRMRETLEMETLLRTAASEMRRALDLDELVVRLVPPGSDGGAEEDSDEG